MAAEASGPPLPELDALVSEQLARWRVPGLALGVLHEGQVHAWGFGAASLETGFPVRPDTLFQIGSISKVFTATLIMNLVDEGLLNLDTPVVRYLPDMRLSDETATGTVTLRHVLTHTSGIYGDLFDDFGWGDDALARGVASAHKARQYTAPGELWAYNNVGFALAGRVAEVVTGEPFEAAMASRVVLPLKLERVRYFPWEVLAYPHAVGSNVGPDDQATVAREYWLSRAVGPAGGIQAPVSDLLRFAAFHMGAPVDGVTPPLSDASRLFMQTPQAQAGGLQEWGIGWAVRKIDGVRVLEHGGGTNGFRAHLTAIPEHGCAVAVLTNGSHGHAAYRAVEAAVIERYVGLHQLEPEPITLSESALAAYVGRYVRPGTDLKLTAVGGGLQLDATLENLITATKTTTRPARAVPVDARTFRIIDGADAGSEFDFIANADGSVRFLRFGGRLLDPASA